MFYLDPMYFAFALPALLLAFYAQWRVRSAYNRYLKVPNAGRMTGAQAAERLLQTAGLYVNLEGIQGQLTDHYDPRSKVLRLSQQVAYSSSVAAVGIVAHEVGHAQQDAQAYLPLKLRSGLAPVVNATSWLAPLIFFLGMLLRVPNLAWVGVYLFGGFVLFALITLPVELNASRWAMRLLEQSNILVGAAELQGARTVLNAAALTYVAALAQAISTMLYYIFLLGGFRRRR